MINQNNKYYTPIIEEFCVGFEYEISPAIPKDIYYKYVFPEYPKVGIEYPRLTTEVGIINSYLNSNQIRVKILDKEDIESLGWEFAEEYERNFPNVSVFKNEIFELWFYKFSKNTINITILIKNDYYIFRGFIKNKSELKKLMKQLNIKE